MAKLGAMKVNHMQYHNFNDIIANVESSNNRNIPGLIPCEDQEFLYFTTYKDYDENETFIKLTNFLETPCAKFGGSTILGCSITIPNGKTYHALSFFGDVDGWKKDIIYASQELKISLARINNKILICNDEMIPLSTCIINFY